MPHWHQGIGLPGVIRRSKIGEQVPRRLGDAKTAPPKLNIFGPHSNPVFVVHKGPAGVPFIMFHHHKVPKAVHAAQRRSSKAVKNGICLLRNLSGGSPDTFLLSLEE